MTTAPDGVRRSEAARRILDLAGELFYRHGVRAVGVDTIVAEAGVAKATLYANFRSKDELVAAWLSRRDAEWRARLAARVEQGGGGPLAVFDFLREWFAEPDFRGCPFVNTRAELGQSNAAATAVLELHRAGLCGYLEELAARAGARDPKGLARELLVLVLGASVTSAMEGTPAAADIAQASAARALSAHGVAIPATQARS